MANSINDTQQGILYDAGNGNLSGIDASTANNVLTSLSSGVAPSFISPYNALDASTFTGGILHCINDRKYIITAGSLVTLPTATFTQNPVTGSSVTIISDTASTITIQTSTLQLINYNGQITAYGGTLSCSAKGNSITFVYSANSTCWYATEVVGTWTPVLYTPKSIHFGASEYLWVDGSDPLGTGTPPTTGSNTLPVDKFSVTTLVQATAGLRPVYNSNVQNSLGAISSNSANSTWVSATAGTFSSGLSLILLATPSTTASAYLTSGNGASNRPAFISDFSSVNYEFLNGADRYTLSSGATGLNLLEIYQTDATSLLGYLNGIQVFSHTPTVAVSGRTLAGLFAASSSLNFSTYTMAEFIIYNAVLTASEKINTRRYIAQKWGLSIAS